MEQRNEMIALNALAKAAELYLNSLDELTRPIMTQHMQSAVSILVAALNPQGADAPDEAEKSSE